MKRIVQSGSWWDTLLVAVAMAALSTAAIKFVAFRGYTDYYGDAPSHLNIARRIIDSRTPGFDQLGVPWLPLPHLLMLPFVGNDYLWQTGLAGAIPSGACFLLAATFLYAAAKSVFASRVAGAAAVGLLALNPNLLYLQSTPMTEPVFLACFMALLYFTARFKRTQAMWLVAAAGLAALAATLTRYEGWLLIPFVAVYFLAVAKKRPVVAAALFSILAICGPLAWLAYNFYYTGDVLTFYNGEGSTIAIQGTATYPGDHNWAAASLQFRMAAQMCLGQPLLWIGAVGAIGALVRRAIWPMVLLSLTPAFYVWSVHSARLPIFVPSLSPFSFYNTRYGLAMLPLAAFATAALVAWTPPRFRVPAALVALAIGLAPWIMDPHMENSITWKESLVNSQARREWTNEAAEYLRSNYVRGTGIFTTFGDVTAIFQVAGIPLRDTLNVCNNPEWLATAARPELFLREEWAVAFGGDPVQTAINRAFLRGPRYTLQRSIIVKGAPVVEIYRRDSHEGLIAKTTAKTK